MWLKWIVLLDCGLIQEKLRGLCAKCLSFMGFPFLLCFILLKLWKLIVNHRKIIKDKPVLLHSTQLDLYSRYIIWHVLVQKFCYRYLPMLFNVKFIFVVIWIQLPWNYYGRLLVACLCCGKNFMSNGCLFTELMIYHVSHAFIAFKS